MFLFQMGGKDVDDGGIDARQEVNWCNNQTLFAYRISLCV